MPNDTNYLTKVSTGGTEYSIKDTVSGYITSDELPAITVNTNTKTLVILSTVENADIQDF